LTPLGIDVVVDNPNVGENLQEQPFVPLSWEAADGIVTLDSLQIPGAINAALAQFYANQTGLLTSFIQSSAYLSFEQIGGHASAVTKTNDPTSPRYQVPSLHKQFELQKVSLKDSNDTTAMIILLEEGLPLPTAPGVPPVIASGNFFSASSILCHPFSRGSVHITSKDPTAAPSIDLNYLSHPLDIAILELATFFLQELVTKEPFASKLKDGGKAFYPGYHHLTKENADAWCKQTLNTSDHPTSSCSMLPKEEGGVVDEKLRVYGVTNLRVVDASVFPMSIRSNPVMTVYAVAEKAADIIKSDWRGRGYKREATGAELNGKVGKKSKRA
jgi:choline dehydrogenase-like flavoprotein